MRPSDTPAGPAPAAPAPPPRFAALRHRNFTTVWLAGMVSNAGAQAQNVAKAWLVVQLTDSPLALALVGFSFGLPLLLLPPLGGALADRLDRVSLLKGTQTLMALQPLALAALVATGHASVWLFCVDSLLGGAVYAINAPAAQALTPALVPRADLLSATALQSAVWTGARLVGPGLGGVLVVALGAAGVFALNGLSTLAVLAALFRLRDLPRRDARPRTAAARGAALRYAWARRPVRAALLLTAGLTLLNGVIVLFPFFARDIWHVGARGYGLLGSALGAGALLGTFGLAARGALRRPAVVVGGGTLVVCGAFLVFAHSPVYAPGLAALLVVGLANAVANAILRTQLQLMVPDAILGRVLALYAIASIGLGYLSSLLIGGLAELVGPVMTVTALALALLVATPFLATHLREAPEEAAAAG